MKPNIAINGFGRIGRLVFRAWLQDPNPSYNIVALNAISQPDTAKHLLRYDSIHGVLDVPIDVDGNQFTTPHGNVALLNQRDINAINWRDINIDIVLECSGKFNDKQEAEKHINIGGAKKVLVSAPCKNADATIVYGVNHDVLTAAHHVVSNASCTTNCLAPMAKIMHEVAGIEKGYVTTIHAYTGDQNLVDASHKDLRRARAAAIAMVPSKTGAAKAVGEVLPALNGKLDGCAMRVPTPNVSFVDLSFISSKNTDIASLNNAVLQASQADMKGVMAYCDEPLVSVDFNHHPASCIFDASQTQVVDNNFVRVGGWYDNEWGFSLRMIDVAKLMINHL